MIKKITAIAIFFVFISFISFRLLSKFVILEWSAQKNDISYNFVAHEGGGINNFTYTNSKEAVDLALANGFKLVELDLIETSDSYLVAAHDWVHFRKITNNRENLDSAMSLKEFKEKKIHNKFTPIDFNDINEYMKINKELFLVVDKCNNFQLINNLILNRHRILVEIFGLRNYIKSILYMTPRPMYSVAIGRFGIYFEYLKITLVGARYVVANSADILKYPELFEMLKKDGIKLLVYTSNDGEFIEHVIGKYDATVYTDFWDLNKQYCTGLSCKSY